MKQNMSHNIYKNIQNKHGQVWTFKDWKKGNNCCLKKKKKNAESVFNSQRMTCHQNVQIQMK